MKAYNYYFNTTQTQNLKIIVCSDIHIYYPKDIKKLIKISTFVKNHKNLDALFIVGDIFDESKVLKNNNITNKIISILKDLSKTVKIYICYGNHDIYYKNKKEWLKNDIFETKFINIIKNIDNIYVKDNIIYKLKERYTVSIINPKYEENINASITNDKYTFLNKLDKNNTNLLLCHYPNVIISLIKNNVLTNIDLGISGHNHNGCTQLKIFPLEKILNKFRLYNQGLITPEKSFKFKNNKYDRGLTKINNTSLIINPSYTTLSHASGIMQVLNPLFYSGVSIIEFFNNK